jgi:psp operon transcriptional activator
MATFMAHSWPGNVRELKNAAERSLYRWIARGEAGAVKDVCIDPFPSRSDASSAKEPVKPATAGALFEEFDLRRELNAVEKRWVADALAASKWNQKEAATLLSLTYDQMRGLIRKHRLRPASAAKPSV